MKKYIRIVLLFCFISIFFYSISFADSRTVFTTDTGSKYHIAGCDYLNSKPHRTTVETAERYGYSPCKVCNPYGLADSYYPNSEDDDSIDWGYWFEGLIFLTIFYMAIPFVIWCLNVEFQSNTGIIWFVVINSLIIDLIWYLLLDGDSLFYAIIFGFINYQLLKNNINIRNSRMKV